MDFYESEVSEVKSFFFMNDVHQTVFWFEDIVFFRRVNYTETNMNSTHPFCIEIKLSHYPDLVVLPYKDKDIFEKDWRKLITGGK